MDSNAEQKSTAPNSRFAPAGFHHRWTNLYFCFAVVSVDRISSYLSADCKAAERYMQMGVQQIAQEMSRIVLILLTFINIHAAGQSMVGRQTFGRKYAKKDLTRITNDSSRFNSGKKVLLLPDKKTAIAFVDSILKAECKTIHIDDEKPYESYLIDNYWWVKGTLPEGAVGGTFKIIVNAVNKELIFLTHGK